MDRPKAVVAWRQAMAEHRLEGLSHQTAFGRVQAGQPCLTASFSSDLGRPFMPAEAGKTAPSVGAPDGGQPFNGRPRRPDVRWAAHESGGLKALRRSDEGRCI